MSKWDHAESIVRRRLGALPEWEAFAMERLDDGTYLVQGCVPATNGKNKTWPKPHAKGTVTETELAAERIEYRRTTGNCDECMGEGKIIRKVSVAGAEYSPCRTCGGNGKAHDDNRPSGGKGDGE